MPDENGHTELGNPTTLRLEGPKPPIYYRPAVLLTIICLSITFLLAAVTSTVGLYQSQHRSVVAEHQRLELARQLATFQTKDQHARDVEQAQQDCHDGRVDNLNRLTSQIAGEIGHLFAVLAAQGGPDAYQPIIDQIDLLSTQRDAADTALSNYLAECKAAYPN